MIAAVAAGCLIETDFDPPLTLSAVLDAATAGGFAASLAADGEGTMVCESVGVLRCGAESVAVLPDPGGTAFGAWGCTGLLTFGSGSCIVASLAIWAVNM